MEEIKIPRSLPLVVIGLISSITAFFLAGFFFSNAHGPNISSPLLVQGIALFIGLAGLLAFVICIREIFFPSNLIINEKGINSRISFRFVPWDEIIAIDYYEGVEGVGKHRANVKGLLIKVKNPEKILSKVKGTRKIGVNRSFNLRGSPVFIPDCTWSWKLEEIREKLETYLTKYRKESKSDARN